MDVLSISQQVYIRRTDGRIHMAEIIKLDGSTSNVTVEWSEDQTSRGKDIPLQTIMKLNPQIFGGSIALSNAMASIAPRPAGQQQNSLGVSRLVWPRLMAGSTALSAVVTATTGPAANSNPDVILDAIERLRLRRERLRQQNVDERARLEWSRKEDPGNPYWEIARMIRLHRLQMSFQLPERLTSYRPKQHQIMVCVRKRPLNQKEQDQRQPDVISVPNQEILIVHEPRKQLNLTKYLEHHNFRFDHTFDEHCSNLEVYERTAKPLVRHIFEGGMATCFAYGQTGSGKTHTMGGGFRGRQQNCKDGIYALAANDVFTNLELPEYAGLRLHVTCSFFELYASRVYDLLMPGKPQLRVLEDGQQQVQVVGLTEQAVSNSSDVLALLELGNSVRTSGQTSANAKSSRSHAVFQILLRSGAQRRLHGKFSLIDLAGNERGADNNSSDRATRLEGAEINKSLLALKECIRALSRQSPHLPFRGSKLTQVLRDSFIGGKKVKTCMIATITPAYHSVEHTLNTLRYADRVKELTPNSIRRGNLRPVCYNSIVRTNSMPQISSQTISQLNRVASVSSVPDTDYQARDNWEGLRAARAREDLAYKETDDYVLVDEESP